MKAASPSAWIEVPQFDWTQLLADGAPTLRLREGQTLFTQGGPVAHVCVIASGRVRLVLMSAAGHEKHMAIVGTGGMVGECGAFLDGRHTMTAVACSDVVARQVERAQLLRTVEQDPHSLRQVLWLTSMKLRILAGQNLLLSQGTAVQRVIHHLVQLAETYGRPAGDATEIGISFTHQEMANIAGLSRVMTSNVLIALRSEGLIDKVKAHWVVLDMPALRQRALEA